MAKREILRDYVIGELSADLVKRRQSAGWRLVAVEWERDSEASTAPDAMDVPYGLRVASDCSHLEEDPVESLILKTVMRMVVQDEPLSKITDELNRAGRLTRAGNAWTIADVFRLMPVLVESGPRMFADPGWPASRAV
jgi:hypothetical protein